MRRSRSLPPARRSVGSGARGLFTNGHEELLRGRGYETHGGRALSKGAFGSLRACVRVSDGEVVAVKVIEAPTHRFKMERRVLEVAKKGASPFVLRLVEAFESGGVACLVTELCDGDAHDLLSARRARSGSSAQKLGRLAGEFRFCGLAPPLAVKIRAAQGCEGGQLRRLISRSLSTRFG